MIDQRQAVKKNALDITKIQKLWDIFQNTYQKKVAELEAKNAAQDAQILASLQAIVALQATVADHESRLDDLENPPAPGP